MDHYAILTAFGQDRPGIVASVAEGLYELQCNIEDTCMTRLRDEFTMMVMVRLPTNVSPDQLADRMKRYTEPLQLTVLCRGVPIPAGGLQGLPDAPTYMLSVYGADRPGIVAKVARVVANHEGNITDVNTRVIGSSERPVYVMLLEIQLPTEQNPMPLETALEALKPELGVDISFRSIEPIRF
jgi:glycine cleavage system transcriptional repressor